MWLLVIERLHDPRPPRRRHVVALGLLLGAGMLTHYLFCSTAVAAALALLSRPRGRRVLPAVVATAGAVFLPWLVLAQGRVFRPPAHLRRASQGISDAIEHTDAIVRRSMALPDVDTGLLSLPWLLPAIGVLVCAALLARGRTDRTLGWALLVPFALPLAVDLVAGTSLLSSSRTTVTVLRAVALGWGWAIAGMARQRLGIVAVVGLVFVVFAQMPNVQGPNALVEGGLRADEVGGADATPLILVAGPGRGHLLQRLRYAPESADVAFVSGPKLRRAPRKQGWSHAGERSPKLNGYAVYERRTPRGWRRPGGPSRALPTSPARLPRR